MAGSPLAPFTSGSQLAHVIDVKEPGDTVANIMLPATSSSITRFGGGSVIVWGGISLEGSRNLHLLANCTLTAVRYQDEMLQPIVRPYTGVVGPGFLLVQDNARPHVARVRRNFLDDEGINAIDWPLHSSDLNPIENLWDVMHQCICCHQVAATDCLGAHRCPDPGLGGDAPGHHALSYQEHAQMLSGVQTSLWGPYTLLSHIMSFRN